MNEVKEDKQSARERKSKMPKVVSDTPKIADGSYGV